MTAEPTTPPTAHPRRQVLCGLMAALLAPAALAACSTETPVSGGAPTTGGGAPTSGGSPAPGGSGGALAAVADIPDGGGVLVDGPDTQVLIVRDGDDVKAFNPACPHQGTAVTPPQGGTITCPNHGSTFDAATGAVTRGPATSGLVEIPVAVEDGKVQLA